MAQFNEGQTATGPNGAKIIFKAGKWQPVTEAGAAPLPAPRFDPVAGIGKQGAGRMANEEAKILDLAFQDARRLDNIVGQASAFGERNRRTGTGGVAAMPWAQGVLSAFSEDMANMRSISNTLTPRMREPGSGSMSDRDVIIFQSSVPNPAMPGNTNRDIRKRFEAAQKRANDYVSFLQEYQAQYGNGALREARRLWQNYASAERIYDDQGNVRTPKSWREYFGSQTQPPAKAETPAGAWKVVR